MKKEFREREIVREREQVRVREQVRDREFKEIDRQRESSKRERDRQTDRERIQRERGRERERGARICNFMVPLQICLHRRNKEHKIPDCYAFLGSQSNATTMLPMEPI